jgi:hypothetical protein
MTASQIRPLLADELYLPDKCCTAILDSFLGETGSTGSVNSVKFDSESSVETTVPTIELEKRHQE